MLNSRDISLLRDDVEANCRMFISLCAEAGYAVLVTGTVRDAEYQRYCASHGLAAKTATRPTFHSVQAGLAFDICQNIKGKEYNDAAFWATVLAIARKVGFTCGADWKSFPDKPHIQWDAHGKYTSRMILARKYPPAMPKYAAPEVSKQESEEDEVITYEKLKDVPEKFRPTIDKLMTAGIIQGDGSDHTGNGDVINLTHEQVRTLVFIYRGGGFDRKLQAAGMEMAV